MTCIISLATIAKQRPSYIAIVVQAYELLHGKSWEERGGDLHEGRCHILNDACKRYFTTIEAIN